MTPLSYIWNSSCISSSYSRCWLDRYSIWAVKSVSVRVNRVEPEETVFSSWAETVEMVPVKAVALQALWTYNSPLPTRSPSSVVTMTFSPMA